MQGEFESTNVDCPIFEVSLDEYSSQFFELDLNHGSFTVTRKSDPQTGDPEEFTIVFKAFGGAEAQLTAEMIIAAEPIPEPYITDCFDCPRNFKWRFLQDMVGTCCHIDDPTVIC